jgi:hypothetical protein
VVLEAEWVGHEWADRRWDSCCPATPNCQCALPGFPFDGADPNEFMVRSEILDHLRRFVASFAPRRAAGEALAASYTWAEAARRHLELYRSSIPAPAEPATRALLTFRAADETTGNRRYGFSLRSITTGPQPTNDGDPACPLS